MLTHSFTVAGVYNSPEVFDGEEDSTCSYPDPTDSLCLPCNAGVVLNHALLAQNIVPAAVPQPMLFQLPQQVDVRNVPVKKRKIRKEEDA